MVRETGGTRSWARVNVMVAADQMRHAATTATAPAGELAATARPDGPLLEGSLGDDPLQPEPATPGGTLIGYARVSTRDQRLDRQFAALSGAGCIRIFAGKKSGKNADRQELAPGEST